MDAPFDPFRIKEQAKLAAEAIKGAEGPIDRSFELNLPRHFDQNWIDDIVLQAHMIEPVWSNYALVRYRPDFWDMIYYVFCYKEFNIENGIVLPSDDSLVIVIDNKVDILVSFMTFSAGDRIYYQLGCHCFSMSINAFCFPNFFREMALSYGLIDYPDGVLIDKHGLRRNGSGAQAYIADARRTQPVFIMRQQANLPTAVKKYQAAAMAALSGFGPVLCNDNLFKFYREHLNDRKYGIIAIAPKGHVFPFERDGFLVPLNFTELLSLCDIRPMVASSSGQTAISDNARAMWLPCSNPELRRALVPGKGEKFRQAWTELLESWAPPTSLTEQQFSVADATFDVELVGEDCVKPLNLDADGYPVDASDIGRWAESRFADQLAIAPRAKRALSKSGHPDPRRIAEALELLAGPKWRGYKGEADTVQAFEAGLLRLRMRDGFSNAERLKGQTGADYVIELQGRKLLLERHLCSNASGFNDPRMIRIYYVFDRLLGKIVIGWLPGHLRTTQS